MEKKKEVYNIKRSIVVDGQKSVLPVKTDFDTEKGTITITATITTKQLSFDKVMKDAVLQQFMAQVTEAYDGSIELLTKFLESQRPGGAGPQKLFEALADVKIDAPEQAMDDEANVTAS